LDDGGGVVVGHKRDQSGGSSPRAPK
jgi:hypothetical protein